jgi:hypothetical protein
VGTGSFLGVKRPGRGADHPPPSSAEVKKEYSYTSTHPLGYCTVWLYYRVDSPSVSLAVHFAFILYTGVTTQVNGLREVERWLPDVTRISRYSTAQELQHVLHYGDLRVCCLFWVCDFTVIPRDAFYSQLLDSWNTQHFLMCYFWFCISYSLNVCLPRSEAW